jgi:hypothetical protein
MRKWLYIIFFTLGFTCLIIYAVYFSGDDGISNTSNQQTIEDYSHINLQPAIFLEIAATPNIEIILNNEQKVISFNSKNKDKNILSDELNIFYQPLDIALSTIYNKYTNNYHMNEDQTIIYLEFDSAVIDYNNDNEEQLFIQLQETIREVYGDKVSIQKISNVIVQEENQYNSNDNISNENNTNENNSNDNTPSMPIAPISPLVPKIDQISEIPHLLDIPEVPKVNQIPNAKTAISPKGM